MHTCPSCQSHSFPANTRGLRVCPQCHATIALSSQSARIHSDSLSRRSRLSDTGNLAKLSGTQAISVLQAARLDKLRQRLYQVPSDDLTVLCACCACRTVLYSFSPDVRPAMLGVIRFDAPTLISVQTGVTWDSDASVLRPVIEKRLLRPSNVRGNICPDCADAYKAQPVSNQSADEQSRQRNRRGSVVRPNLHNTPAQRIEADIALLEVERAKRNLADSGCPSWAIEAEAIRATATADGPCWAHTFDGRWLGQATVYAGHRRRDGQTQTVVPVYRSDYFEPVGTFDPIAQLDHAKYRGPASVSVYAPEPIRRWTGRLRLTSAALDSTVYSWSRLAPFTGYRPLRPYVGIGHADKSSPKPAYRPVRSFWREVTRPVSTESIIVRPSYRIPDRFSLVPLGYFETR